MRWKVTGIDSATSQVTSVIVEGSSELAANVAAGRKGIRATSIRLADARDTGSLETHPQHDTSPPAIVNSSVLPNESVRSDDFNSRSTSRLVAPPPLPPERKKAGPRKLIIFGVVIGTAVIALTCILSVVFVSNDGARKSSGGPPSSTLSEVERTKREFLRTADAMGGGDKVAADIAIKCVEKGRNAVGWRELDNMMLDTTSETLDAYRTWRQAVIDSRRD